MHRPASRSRRSSTALVTLLAAVTGFGALAPAAVAQGVPTSGDTADEPPAQVRLEGEVVVFAVHDRPGATTPSAATLSPVRALLRSEDGSLLPLTGLDETSDVRTGDTVRVLADVPEALEDAVADDSSDQALGAARTRPAAVGSPVSTAAAEASDDSGTPLEARSTRVLRAERAPTASVHDVTVAVVDLGARTDEVAPSDAEVADLVDRTSDFWAEQSEGQVGFRTTTTTRYSSAVDCETDALWEEAEDRTRWSGAEGTNLVLVLVNEDEDACGYGLGSVGGSPGSAGVAQIANADDLSLLAHEVGHNMSFEHAETLTCEQPTADVSTDGLTYLDGASTSVEGCRVMPYGDIVDVMSFGGIDPGSLSALARARVGFLAPAEQQEISAPAGASAATTVTLRPLSAAAGSGLKTVRLVDPRTGVSYQLENRQAVGRDAVRMDILQLAPGLRVLRAYDDPATTGPGAYQEQATLALDGTPTAGDLDDPDFDRAVPAGATFTSYSGGVEVTPTQLSDGSVQVQVRLLPDGASEPPPPPAVVTLAAAPRLTTAGGVVEASVSGGSGSPAGTVEVRVAGRATASAPVSAGRARVTLGRLAAGRQSVAVVWKGTGGAVLAASTPSDVVVARTASRTRASAPANVRTRKVVPVRVEVTSAWGALAGTAQVVDARGRVLGSARVTGGKAQVNVPSLPRGRQTLGVVFAGTSSVLASRTSVVVTAR